MFFVRKNDELGQLTQEQWYKGFEKSSGKEEKGDLQIASVDVTGKAASVKVVEIYEGSMYTDYISLLKLADGWKIVNKIFVVEKRAAQRVTEPGVFSWPRSRLFGVAIRDRHSEQRRSRARARSSPLEIQPRRGQSCGCLLQS